VRSWRPRWYHPYMRDLPWWRSGTVMVAALGVAASVTTVLVNRESKRAELAIQQELTARDQDARKLQAEARIRFDYLELLVRAGRSLPDRITFIRFIESTSDGKLRAWARTELGELALQKKQAEAGFASLSSDRTPARPRKTWDSAEDEMGRKLVELMEELRQSRGGPNLEGLTVDGFRNEMWRLAGYHQNFRDRLQAAMKM
jgi:hypothetical protein